MYIYFFKKKQISILECSLCPSLSLFVTTNIRLNVVKTGKVTLFYGRNHLRLFC